MSYDIVLNDLGPNMVLSLTRNDSAFVLNASTDTAVLRYEMPSGTVTEVSLAITNASTGEVTRTWLAGDLPEVGGYKGQVTITRTGDTTFPRTFPSDGSNIIWWVHVKI